MKKVSSGCSGSEGARKVSDEQEKGGEGGSTQSKRLLIVHRRFVEHLGRLETLGVNDELSEVVERRDMGGRVVDQVARKESMKAALLLVELSRNRVSIFPSNI